MTQKTLKLATRESLLALWQANYVKARLEALGHVVELLPIKTEGDKKLDVQLSKFGGKGLFLKELEQALLNGDADFAVHSMKDVPVLMPEGLEIAAICERESPFDALVSNTYSSFEALPKGAKVGTSSLRRTALLRQARPDLEIAFLRGNVQTRLRKLDDGEYDAIILAEAGLIRLKLEERIAQRLPREICLPAVGQGAVGIEICSKQSHIRAIIEQLADDQTQRCVQAERQVSLRLGGGCHSPIAVFAQCDSGQMIISAQVADLQGQQVITAKAQGAEHEPLALGDQVADILLAEGAAQLLASFEQHE